MYKDTQKQILYSLSLQATSDFTNFEHYRVNPQPCTAVILWLNKEARITIIFIWPIFAHKQGISPRFTLQSSYNPPPPRKVSLLYKIYKNIQTINAKRSFWGLVILILVIFVFSKMVLLSFANRKYFNFFEKTIENPLLCWKNAVGKI